MKLKGPNDKRYKKFKLFWDGEIEKKLFRCAKEFNFYGRLKKNLIPSYYADDPNVLFYEMFFRPAVRELNEHKGCVIDFKRSDFYCPEKKRLFQKYPAGLALHDKRHLSQIVGLYVIRGCVSYETLDKAFMMFSEEVYKGHTTSARFKEKLYYLKLFFI